MKFVEIEDGLWVRPECVQAVEDKGVRGCRICLLDGTVHDSTSFAKDVVEKLEKAWIKGHD